jgi:hypothetical protein
MLRLDFRKFVARLECVGENTLSSRWCIESQRLKPRPFSPSYGMPEGIPRYESKVVPQARYAGGCILTPSRSPCATGIGTKYFLSTGTSMAGRAFRAVVTRRWEFIERRQCDRFATALLHIDDNEN